GRARRCRPAPRPCGPPPRRRPRPARRGRAGPRTGGTAGWWQGRRASGRVRGDGATLATAGAPEEMATGAALIPVRHKPVPAPRGQPGQARLCSSVPSFHHDERMEVAAETSAARTGAMTLTQLRYLVAIAD